MVTKCRHYEKLPNDILGTIYFYLLNEHSTRLHLQVKHEYIQSIERIASNRGISSLELETIGHWFIQKEKSLVEAEYTSDPFAI